MKLTCCLIVRDESKNLERCLQSVRPHVDQICIVDTGSTDNTPEIARKYADRFEVWTGCNDADGKIADFSAARNRNLAQAGEGAVLWLDGDDELVGGEHLRKLVSEAPGGDWAYLMPYEYDHDDQGRCVTLQWRERLVSSARRFEWRGPVHEGLLGVAGTDVRNMATDLVRVVHRRKQSGKAADPGRNLRILRGWFAKHGEADVRLMHYFGSELLINRHIGEAMYWLRRHVAMSNWSDERCLSLLHLARVHLSIGDGDGAAKYLADALLTKRWPDPLWLLGQAFCMLADQGIDVDYNTKRGASFLEQGMAIPSGQTLLMHDPTARNEACHWLSIARYKLGDLEGAIKWASEGYAAAPEHVDMGSNLRLWQAEREKQTVRASMVKLHELGAIQREAGILVEGALSGAFKVERRQQIPERANGTQRDSAAARRKAHETRPGSGLRIAFWLGHQMEPWTPETLEQGGMGGSETMAWEMSRRLAKSHDVEVYAHCDPRTTYGFDGVAWMDASHFEGTDCDVLIVSRQAAAVTLPHSAKVRVLWVHDVHCGPDLTPDIASRYDFVWCLSEWHKAFFLQCYPWIPKAKVEVTRNGIDLSKFNLVGMSGANPHRAIYSSSPDRGLITAVKAWPEVRKRIPDAELHCFYGFENWEKALIANPGIQPAEWLSREAKVELTLLAQATEGIVLHGRVSQRELIGEMLRSGVWVYPTWFSETSCITAMQAQAAGLQCVCPETAALGETVQRRVWTGDLVSDIVSAMQSGPTAYDVSRFDLDSLAESWQQRFAQALDRVVPAFCEPEAAE